MFKAFAKTLFSLHRCGGYFRLSKPQALPPPLRQHCAIASSVSASSLEPSSVVVLDDGPLVGLLAEEA